MRKHLEKKEKKVSGEEEPRNTENEQEKNPDPDQGGKKTNFLREVIFQFSLINNSFQVENDRREYQPGRTPGMK
mgnify:CR=1 FL=1